MIRLILLFALLLAPLHAADCVPLAFATLSTLASHPIPYDVWAKDLKTTATYSPNLPDAISSWNRHFLLAPLVCVYSDVSGSKTVERTVDAEHDTPYLWIGEVPPAMIAPTGGDANCHAAIALFHADHVDLVHTLNDGIIVRRFYVEHLSWEAFVKRTYVVYEIVPSLPGMTMHYGRLPAEVLK